jgi:hypothetical protein
MITRKTVAALSVAALAATTFALPAAAANSSDQPIQLAACGAKKGCNPCAAKKGCNPCAAKANPCAAKGNPCAAKSNPCAAKK